jgi:WD40 repeat protein
MQPSESEDHASRDSSADSGLSFAGLTEFHRGPAAAGTADLAPGARLGDVTIIRLVDEGGMGRVYEGLQGMPCRTVAVKVIKPGMLSPGAARRFEYEAQILGRLTHPGIARIYSLGMQHLPSGEVPYFVMEFIDDARSITAFAKERDLSTRDRVTLFREVCRAVAHGHQRGVIHRDLKPGNILVDGNSQPKIIDFGVARGTDGSGVLPTMHTDAGQLVGTLAYMAPEQFANATDDLDVRADVYALGVVLYELLAGSPPYDLSRHAVYDVARIVKDVEPKSLSMVNPKLRGDITTIVAKCLDKERGRRYSSAAELEAELGRYLRGEAITASPPSLVDSIVRLARRHRLAATAAAAVVMTLLLAVVGISIFAIRADRQRELADVARRDAVHQARQAADERETAQREKARADAEADTSRHRLYVANLRSLQSYLADKNLRAARQLYQENLALVGAPLPLEMHCLGAQLDDALVVRDTGQASVSRLAYTRDGSGLVAIARAAPTFPFAQQAVASRHFMTTFYRHPRSAINSTRNDILSFAAGNYHEYAPVEPDAAAWKTVWHPSIGVPELVAIAEDGLATPLAVSPSGSRLAVQIPDGGIRIVDAVTRVGETVLEGHRGRLKTVAFSPDGSRLAALAAHGALSLWDATDGRLLLRGDKKHETLRLEFSPDSSRLAVVMRDTKRTREVRIHDARDGRPLSSVHIPKGQGESDWLLAFSPEGSRLTTSSHEHDLHVWDVESGHSLAVLQGHTAVISAVTFSPDGQRIASGATNGNIRLWNAETFALERELMGHDDSVGTLGFRPDGEELASGSIDRTVRIWSSTATAPLAVLAGLRGMTAVAFSPDGRQLAVAPQGGGDVELWNPRTAERLRSLVGAGGTVAQLAYSPDGRLVAAAHETPRDAGDIRVWRTDTGEQVQAFGDHGLGAVTVAFSPDGTRLLTTSGDEMLMAWDVHTGRQLMAIFARHQSLLFHRTGAVFGLAGRRVAYKQPHLFDGATGELVATLPPQGQVTALAASPDGRTLAAGMAIGNVYLTDFATGTRIGGLVGHVSSVRAIAFSPDNTRVVTGSLDGNVRLWDATTGNPVREFVGHEGGVEQALFSPDGRRVITAATDGTIRIWHADQGQELCNLPGHLELPRAIALSPDGGRLVTAASDGSVRIWGLSNADIITARREAATASEPSVTVLP